jgi:hypothetical protein
MSVTTPVAAPPDSKGVDARPVLMWRSVAVANGAAVAVPNEALSLFMFAGRSVDV